MNFIKELPEKKLINYISGLLRHFYSLCIKQNVVWRFTSETSSVLINSDLKFSKVTCTSDVVLKQS